MPEPWMADNSASLIRCCSIRARTAGESRVLLSSDALPRSSPGEGDSRGASRSAETEGGWAEARPGAGVAATASSITAISVPTVTVVPSLTLISLSTPASGAGTSAFTLSVITSTRPSYFLTWSPGFLSHLEMVPSVIDSPSCGILTEAIAKALVGRELPGLQQDFFG